jgi:hypothetical protein
MFAAYFDDSGTHDDTGTLEGSQVVAAAGYVGLPSEWEALEADWNAVLDRESLPFYHSVACAHRDEHFKGKSDTECNALHRTFVEIITSRQIVPVGAALWTAGFHDMYTRALEPGRLPVARPGYYSCLMSAWYKLGFVMLAADPSDQVSIVLEESPKTQRGALATYEEAMQRPEWQGIRSLFAGPPAFRPKRGYPQLQAADVLAYEMALKLRRQFGSAPEIRRKSWEALARHAAEQAVRIDVARIGMDTLLVFADRSGRLVLPDADDQ